FSLSGLHCRALRIIVVPPRCCKAGVCACETGNVFWRRFPPSGLQHDPADRVEIVVAYVKRILQPDEQVLRVGRVHWMVYLRPVVLAAICGLFLHLASRPDSLPTPMLVGASIASLLAAIAFARTWFWKWATELAITNRRIIYKRGLIWRETVEMNTEKVE